MQIDKRISTYQTPFKISSLCPHCGSKVVLDPLQNSSDFVIAGVDANKEPLNTFFGFRVCPGCFHLCVAFARGKSDIKLKIIDVWPKNRFTDRSEGMPEMISKSLAETYSAFTHGLYVMAAIGIRRTLEMICDDVGAPDGTLHSRIQYLKNNVILPKDMLDAFIELKFLGNDAAHINSKHFNVEREEVAIALELITEITRALYHHKHLLAQLQALKKPSA